MDTINCKLRKIELVHTSNFYKITTFVWLYYILKSNSNIKKNIEKFLIFHIISFTYSYLDLNSISLFYKFINI